MAEHDPLAAEFTALRAAVLVRAPGPNAARRTVRRRRRQRAAVVLTSLVVFAVTAVGVALASVGIPVHKPPTALPTASASLGVAATGRSELPVPASSPAAGRTTPAPGIPPPSIPLCKQYGAVLLDRPTASSVTVKVDQRGPYPLCPGERVRVFVAVYRFDAQGKQQLFYSKVAFLDAAHNPLTLPYSVPTDCHNTVYVISGGATIKQTLPPVSNLYADAAAAFGSPAWGPYNGIVWVQDQARCVY
jgi:hypothetical protein